MPRSRQKTPIKLGATACVALLAFNYPLLSLYRGEVGSWPVLYLALFGIWLGVIVLAWWITEGAAASSGKIGFNTQVAGDVLHEGQPVALHDQRRAPHMAQDERVADSATNIASGSTAPPTQAPR